MSKQTRLISAGPPDALLGRVVAILEQARGNVVRAVNTNMVLAYWLIGREIVEELQRGEQRAVYGKKTIESLSVNLTERYGKGFSAQTLWKFRLFYQVYSGRISILSPAGDEVPHGFSPHLTWSHYRAVMPVETLVHHNQALYYKALQDSHTGAVDCRPFIGFMLDAIGNSLYKYIDVATETAADVGVNVPVNVPVNEVSDKILILLRANPKATAQKMALALGVTDKTVKRHLKTLREQGWIKRVGSDKAGHWEVIERPS